MMVIGKTHDASAISFGEAKEGLMEAYNFSSVQSVTLIHLINEKKKVAKTNASVRSLAKSIYSIDTGTSKVTEDDTDDKIDSSGDEDSSNSNDTGPNARGKEVAIEGMGILEGKTGEQEAATNRPDKDAFMKDANSYLSKNNDNEEEFQDKGLIEAGADLTRRMEEASMALIDTLTSDDGSHTNPINLLSSDEDGKTYKGDNSIAQSKDEELDMKSYDSNITEVNSGVLDANHSQRYVNPANFCQALLNEAGPTVGAMKVMLEMMRTEFDGELLGLKADLTHFSQHLINFLIEESGENTKDAIAFLDQTSADISQYKEDTTRETRSHIDISKKPESPSPDKGDERTEASKTQGTVPRAPEATPTEGIATTIKTTAGDEEGPQSMSMVPDG
jgi:hypothetical protein